MGSGGSKLDQVREMPTPGKLRPLLHRRLDEIKRKRRPRRKARALKKSTTQSKKVLLDDNDTDSDDNEENNVSSDDDNALKVVPEPECDNNESEIATCKEQIKIVKVVEVKPVLLVCPTFATMLHVDQHCTDIEAVQVVSSSSPTSPIVLIRERSTKKYQSENEEKAEKCIEKRLVMVMEAMAVTVEEVKASETVEDVEKENADFEGKQEEKQEQEHEQHGEEEQHEHDNKGKQEQEQKHEEEEQHEHEHEQKEVTEHGGEERGEQEQKGEERKQEEEEEEEEEENDMEERLICPGSPSFREYCIRPLLTNEKETAHKIDLEKKSESGHSFGHGALVSETEDSVNKKKRVKRGRMKVVKIPKANSMPRAMKNLLMVNACYNPACGRRGGHGKVRLLEGSP